MTCSIPRWAIHGLNRCSGRDRCGQSDQGKKVMVGMRCRKGVLRWERNRVLESESIKEEHWLVVVELGDVLEKVLKDFGKLFQRIGEVWLYERLHISREEVVEGRSRVRWLDERVEPAGLILIGFRRYLVARYGGGHNHERWFCSECALLFWASAEISVQGDMLYVILDISREWLRQFAVNGHIIIGAASAVEIKVGKSDRWRCILVYKQ